ncbi:ammonium transporter, partial [Leucobacter sp. M11]|uniref:ammonium transporter n=1 Tax=Leucobacter sp. M11 TaxID=2993565 RepID=UPI002D89A2F5|nr:ammonia channel protein [Leucobacter sp. M11]
RPHNIPLVLLGGSLLWFGWFGFNAGLAADDDQVGLIVTNTLVAPAAGILGWLVTERLRGRKPTSIGAISGVVAGLVAITPACADLTPGWSIVLGLLAGAVCALAIDLKYRLGYDDSLDVVGLHLVAGVLGTLFLGFAATDTGLVATGDRGLLLVQLISVLGVGGYSFLVSLVLAVLISRTVGFRVAERDELAGVDRAGHGEDAYALTPAVTEESSV